MWWKYFAYYCLMNLFHFLKCHFTSFVYLFLNSSCFVCLFCFVQSPCCVWIFTSPWTAAHQASLFFTISWSLLKLMYIESVMLSNHLIFCHPLFLLSIFPMIRIFSDESALRVRWPKSWRPSFSISSSKEYSGLITLLSKGFSSLQFHSSKASILQH